MRLSSHQRKEPTMLFPKSVRGSMGPRNIDRTCAVVVGYLLEDRRFWI
jgi:hypothetical protein